jgi:hypothetical protein
MSEFKCCCCCAAPPSEFHRAWCLSGRRKDTVFRALTTHPDQRSKRQERIVRHVMEAKRR